MVVFPGELLLLLLLVDIHMASLNGGMSLPKYHLECSRRGLPLDRDLDFYIDRGRDRDRSFAVQVSSSSLLPGIRCSHFLSAPAVHRQTSK